MTTFDLTPLYRTAIGFDRLADLLSGAAQTDNGYPPYNIEAVDDNHYRITMAVAGFGRDEIDIVSQQETLTVSGRKADEEKTERRYLHRGIATRGFERRFQLADYVRVIGANMENGLLHIDLAREIPEALKPRRIEIGSGEAPRVIEGKKQKAA